MKLTDYKENLLEFEIICVLKYYELYSDIEFLKWLNLYYKTLYNLKKYKNINMIMGFSIIISNNTNINIKNKLNECFNIILNYIKTYYKLENIIISNKKIIPYYYSNNKINQICECSICLNEKDIKNFIKFQCNHKFCKECVLNTFKTSINIYRCALCRSDIDNIVFN